MQRVKIVVERTLRRRDSIMISRLVVLVVFSVVVVVWFDFVRTSIPSDRVGSFCREIDPIVDDHDGYAQRESMKNFIGFRTKG